MQCAMCGRRYEVVDHRRDKNVCTLENLFLCRENLLRLLKIPFRVRYSAAGDDVETISLEPQRFSVQQHRQNSSHNS